MGEVITIAATGGAVRVAFAVGANPDATADSILGASAVVSANGMIAVACDEDDTRVAVADA